VKVCGYRGHVRHRTGGFDVARAGLHGFHYHADLIAEGLSPFQPGSMAVRAGRLMLGQIHEHARKGECFAFETTLSGRGYARLIPRWQGQGYQVKLFFLRLPTADMA